MTKASDIIAELAECSFNELEEIRSAADAKIEEARSAFIAQAEAMGISCEHPNGKKRGRRANKHADAD